MFSNTQLAEIRGDKPSMDHPVLFSGWGGEYSTVAIFRVCPEYIGSRKIALFFNDKRLAEDNNNVQKNSGSGFEVDAIIAEGPDRTSSIIIMHPDSTQVKDSILIGMQEQKTQDCGCEYAIAFYCYGEFDLAIVAFDDEAGYEELYTRSFCCK